MSIEVQFNLIAREYDINRKRFIPCYDEFYNQTTAFVSSIINNPKTIVDLGAGTGLLTELWYRRFPDAKYVLVDIAAEMLEIARKRFAGIANISYLGMNYIDKLPCDACDAFISALSIHHLEDADKIKLFSNIYDKLPKGGIFVNYDQFRADSKAMSACFDDFWIEHINNSGLSAKDIALWHERRKLDRECSVPQETDMLKRCGFDTVECIYANRKFCVMAAIK